MKTKTVALFICLFIAIYYNCEKWYPSTNQENLLINIDSLKNEINTLKTIVAYNKSSIDSLKKSVNSRSLSTFLCVCTNKLNIRRGMGTNYATHFVAYKGALLRIISKSKEWYYVQFLIKNIPYSGYVRNKPKYVEKLQLYESDFSDISKSQLIYYNWFSLLGKEIKGKLLNRVGISIHKNKGSIEVERLYEQIYNKIRTTVKTIRLYNVSNDNFKKMIIEHGLDGILQITIVSDDEIRIYLRDSYMMDIFLRTITLQPI